MLFKIWSADREKKCMVTAVGDDIKIDNIILKGKPKKIII